MQLIKEQILLPEKYSVNAEAGELRAALVLTSQAIVAVTNSDQNDVAGVVCKEIRQHLKGVEAARVELTKPLLDGQRLLKSLSDDHCKPLKDELNRVERLGTDYFEAEQRRVAAAEEARRLAFEKAERERLAAEEAARKAALKMTTDAGMAKALKAEAKAVAAEAAVQTIIAAPLPEVQRTKGQSMRKILKWELTDIHALYKSRPELCNIEPKASAIQATCVPEMPVAGLKLWWENKANYTTR